MKGSERDGTYFISRTHSRRTPKGTEGTEEDARPPVG